MSLKSIFTLILTVLLIPACQVSREANPPNIIYIMTDQQAFDAMSCAGNPLVNTPALDELASKGVRFENAYCAFPLCVPSRAAMFSGMMPHEAGIFVNTRAVNDEKFPFETLAARLRDNGYYTHYIGKWHLTIPRSDTLQHGFMGIEYPGAHGFDSEYARLAIDFLKRNKQEPFFLVVSFVNPHDCCQLARKEDLADFEGAIAELPSPDELPELPGNFGIPENEPDFFREWQARNSERVYRSYFWNEQDFKEYQWGYYRLVEKVDSLIATVLDVSYSFPGGDNTTIIFSSDHGDGISRHHWNQKWSPYDEASRVPFIIAGSGVERQGVTDSHLVSSGLDLFPTVCDLGGIDIPDGLRGRSLKPLLEKDIVSDWREYLVTEMSFGNWVDRYHQDTFPKARMIRSAHYKYVIFDRGEIREQLTDMRKDPGEMKNLVMDPEYSDILQKHRDYIEEWVELTNDNFKIK